MENYLLKRNFYNKKIIYGNNIYLYDDEDNEILDGCSNSMNVNLGYNVRELENRFKAQLRKISFMHTGKGITNESLELSKKLHDLVSPIGNYYVYLTTSGSSCIEAALRVSYMYHSKKRRKLLSLYGSYHGSTLGALSVSGHKKFLDLYPDVYENTTFLPIERQWFDDNLDFKQYSAVVLDSMVTNPLGSEIVNKEYLQLLCMRAQDADCVTVFDEIATSLGRLGTNFGFEDAGIAPDVFCISKGLGVGYSNIGAVFVKDNIAKRINSTEILGHTFNASPLDCSIGMEVLDYIEKNEVLNHVKSVSHLMDISLENLTKEFSCIKCHKGKGLMRSIHFTDSISSEKFRDRCMKNGLMLLNVEYDIYNHVTLCPPLIITENQVNSIFKILKKTLEDMGN